MGARTQLALLSTNWSTVSMKRLSQPDAKERTSKEQPQPSSTACACSSRSSTRALTLETEVVSGQTVGFNSKGIDETDVVSVTDPTYLVTVQDLQSDREWNSRDGDVSKLFISKSITK